MAIKSFLSEGGFSVGSVGSAPIEVIDSSGNITAVGLTVSGNLVVNGSTTTINSTTTTLDDPIFTLGGDTVPASDDNKDRGIEFRWHNGSLAKVGFFGYDDSTGKFIFIPDATNTSEVFSGTKGTIDANLEWADVLSKPSPVVTVTLTGDVTGTANATLTSLGNGTITVATTIAADSIALGTDTTGNYVASITNGSYITGGNGGSEGAALTLAVDATSANTASKVVARDASGNFSAGVITGTRLESTNSGIAQLYINSTTNGSKEIVFQNNGSTTGYVWQSGSYVGLGGGSGSNSIFVNSGQLGIGTTSPAYKTEVLAAAAAYWNGTAFTAGPLALAITNSSAGGYDPVLMFRQADSAGTLTDSASIGMVGKAAWTAGSASTQISDMYFLLRNTASTLVERMRLTNDGALGIGISAPAAALHVARTGADEQLILGSAATNRDISMAMYSGTTKAEVLRFQSAFRLMHGVSNAITQQSFFTSGGERLTIVSGGNVGVGTTSPGAKLHVAGPHADEGADRAATTALIVDTKTDGTGDGKTYIKTGWVNTGNYGVSTLGVGYYATGSQVRDVITMLGTGRVGVGTTTPTQRLHLNGGVLRISGGGASSNGEINLDSGTEYDGWQVRKESSTMWGVKSVTSGNDLAIFVDNTTARGVYIKTGGNVGVGTTDPQTNFHVVGTANTIVSRIGASGQYLTIGSYTPNSAGATLGYNGTQYLGLNAFFGVLVGRTYVSNNTTAPADGMIIQGNLGVGATSPSDKLHVVGNTLVTGGVYNNANGGIRISNPGGAGFEGAGAATGAFKIKFPTATYNNNTMMMFVVDIYNYSTGTSLRFRIGGYNYQDGQWYNTFAEQTSDLGVAAYNVRFGNDGTANCVWIGELASTWAYPKVYVSEFMAGSGGAVAGWASGWAISQATSFDTVVATRNASVGVNNNNIGTYGVSSITGTANQVTASASTGAVTLSLPQNIHTAATPTFGGGTLNGTLTVVKSNGGNVNGSANAAIYLSQDESSIQGPGTNTVIRMGGNLVLGANSTWIAATNGTTAITVNNSQNATFAGSLTVSGGSTTVDSGSSGIVTVGYATALSSSNQGNSAIGVVGRNLRASSTNDDLLILKTNAAIGAQGVVFKTGTIELYAVSGSVTAGNVLSSGLAATFTTATSTIAGNLAVNGGTGTIDATSGTASATLNLVGRSSGTAKTASIASNSAGSLLLSAEGAGSALGIAANTGNTTVAYNLTVNGTGKQTLGQNINATVYAGNTSTTDQAIILSNTRRANYGDVMIAKNLEGVASTDSYATPGTSAATGYAAVEMRYGGVVRVYGNSGATTAAAVVAPNVLAEFTPTAIGLNLNTTVTGNLTVSGNLIINGTTTTVNSTTTTLDDPIITLGGDTAPTVDDNKDRGVEFRWHNGTAAKVGFFGYDDSTGYFTFIPDATNTSEVFSGTQGDIQAANFRGNLIGNVTGNVSGSAGSVATLTAGTYLTGGSFNGSTNVTFAVDATSANTASKVVARDGSGNFSAGTITATLAGLATSETLSTVTGRGASTSSQISVTTSSGGSMFTGTKSGSGYSDGVSGATFKSILDNPNGGAGFAFVSYYNASGGTIGASIRADGFTTLTYNPVASLANNAFSITTSNYGSLHFDNGEGTTGNARQTGITWRGGSTNVVQAGIYVSQNSATGTTMALATTDNYSTGPQIGMTISTTGVVNFPRNRPTYAGNVILDAGNYNNYTDPIIQALDSKASVKAATTADITLSGTQTIDGVALVAGDRVLVKNQNTQTPNGIYVVSAGAWTRATDFDTWSKLIGAFVFVEQGSTNGLTGWLCAAAAGGAFGSNPIMFSQFSHGGSVNAGTGLTKTTNNVGSGPFSTFSITNTTVSAASYGSASSVATFTVNAQGQLTAASSVAIAISSAAVSGLANSATITAASTNTANQIVLRDGSGNFSAGTITATLAGLATSETLATVTGRGATTTSAIGVTGGAKITIQNGVDGGSSRGLLLWTDTDTNWGIYMATAGANKSLAAGTSVASIDARTSHHIRYRVANSSTQGHLWENSSEQVLMSLTGDTGNLYTRGQIYAGNSTTNLVLHTGNYNSYAPTLTGTGASGTWGISITGNAATATTASNVNNGTLTLAVSGTGLSGSASFTANQSGNSTFTVTSNATSANAISTIVARDSNGDFNSRNITLTGSLNAVTKSFVIAHPTKEGKKLRYGSLEGPENGVYVRGKLKGSNIIELPDYWTKLVDPESITVQLTPIGSHQKLYVEKIEDNKVYIANENLLAKAINCFFYVLAERCDVEKLEVEIDA